MGSTVRSTHWSQTRERGNGSLQWRDWPLADRLSWSWAILLLIAATAVAVYWVSESVVLALAITLCLAASLGSFLLPTHYEVTPLGLRRRTLRRIRLYRWPAVRAYQLRTSGAILFQQPDPTPLDVASSFFVPFPPDVDDLIAALRLYLPHAVEVPPDFGRPEPTP